jgi:aspartate-semialdehyde dehydrogenase
MEAIIMLLLTIPIMLKEYIKALAIAWMKMECLLAVSGRGSLAVEKILDQVHKVWGSATHSTQV